MRPAKNRPSGSVRPPRAIDPSQVDAQAVRQAVRELQRLGLMSASGGGIEGWFSMDCIPLIAQRLGFRKKVVQALKAELAEVHRRHLEEHLDQAVLAGRQYGWISPDAAAFILRGQGHSSDKEAR